MYIFSAAALLSKDGYSKRGRWPKERYTLKLSCHHQMAVRFSVLPADVTLSPKPFGHWALLAAFASPSSPFPLLRLHRFFFDNMGNIHYIFICLASEIGHICIY